MTHNLVSNSLLLGAVRTYREEINTNQATNDEIARPTNNHNQSI